MKIESSLEKVLKHRRSARLVDVKKTEKSLENICVVKFVDKKIKLRVKKTQLIDLDESTKCHFPREKI